MYNIKYSGNEDFDLELTNLAGRILWSGHYLHTQEQNEIKISTSGLAKGNYIITMKTSNGHAVTQMVLEY